MVKFNYYDDPSLQRAQATLEDAQRYFKNGVLQDQYVKSYQRVGHGAIIQLEELPFEEPPVFLDTDMRIITKPIKRTVLDGHFAAPLNATASEFMPSQPKHHVTKSADISQAQFLCWLTLPRLARERPSGPAKANPPSDHTTARYPARHQAARQDIHRHDREVATAAADLDIGGVLVTVQTRPAACRISQAGAVRSYKTLVPL